jgi:hypothetical protein
MENVPWLNLNPSESLAAAEGGTRSGLALRAEDTRSAEAGMGFLQQQEQLQQRNQIAQQELQLRRRSMDQQLTLQREQMQRAHLENITRLGVMQEYHRQMSNLRSQQLQEQAHRTDLAASAAARKYQAMQDYEVAIGQGVDPMQAALLHLGPAMSAGQASLINAYEKRINAPQATVPQGISTTADAWGNKYYLDAKGNPHPIKPEKAAADPDWYTKNQIEDLQGSKREIEKQLETVANAKIKSELEKRLVEINSDLKSLLPQGKGGGAQFKWDPTRGMIRKSDDSVVVPTSGEGITFDEETGMMKLPEASSLPAFQGSTNFPFNASPGASAPATIPGGISPGEPAPGPYQYAPNPGESYPGWQPQQEPGSYNQDEWLSPDLSREDIQRMIDLEIKKRSAQKRLLRLAPSVARGTT